jgi:S-adenosylmethionine hydrolase
VDVATAYRFVTFLSDYGLEDEFVGVCHGVIKRFAPDVEIIDIAHGIPPQEIGAGAAVLASAVPFMPKAVHMAVVDPGVGTKRRAIVLHSVAGPPLVGPDNGLLWLAAEALGGAKEAYSIENKELFLEGSGRTFNGRDIFAPVAARLALGMPMEEVGPNLPLADIIKLDVPGAKAHDDHIHARIVQCDHFGNLQLNADRLAIESIGILFGDLVEIRVGARTYAAEYAEAFGHVPIGKLVLLEDSHRSIALAINQGDARQFLEASRSDPVIIARRPVGG